MGDGVGVFAFEILSNTYGGRQRHRGRRRTIDLVKAYSKDMERLNKRGVRRTVRPSGHNIKPSFSKVEAGGSIPSNVVEEELPIYLLRFGNNAANDAYTERCKKAEVKVHPARFPAALPEFFIKLLTNEGYLVLDPFAGSNTTGFVPLKNCNDGGSR